jgi:hypothetical protein
LNNSTNSPAPYDRDASNPPHMQSNRGDSGGTTYTVSATEAELLARILGGYLGDLRMEIADTENYSMRESMKQDEAVIRTLLQRFRGEETAGAMADTSVGEVRELNEEGL